MMPTIGCDEGTLFSSFSVAGGCGSATSCAGILSVIDVFEAININTLIIRLLLRKKAPNFRPSSYDFYDAVANCRSVAAFS